MSRTRDVAVLYVAVLCSCKRSDGMAYSQRGMVVSERSAKRRADFGSSFDITLLVPSTSRLSRTQRRRSVCSASPVDDADERRRRRTTRVSTWWWNGRERASCVMVMWRRVGKVWDRVRTVVRNNLVFETRRMDAWTRSTSGLKVPTPTSGRATAKVCKCSAS